MRPSITTLALLLALGACGGGEGVSPDSSVEGEAASTSTSIDRGQPDAERVPTSTVTPPTGEVPDEVMESILARVRQQLDVDTLDGIEVTRAEAVTWPDGSLGCPEPGEFYTQALVEGFHVELTFDGQTFDYRVGGPENIKLCERQLRP